MAWDAHETKDYLVNINQDENKIIYSKKGTHTNVIILLETYEPPKPIDYHDIISGLEREMSDKRQPMIYKYIQELGKHEFRVMSKKDGSIIKRVFMRDGILVDTGQLMKIDLHKLVIDFFIQLRGIEMVVEKGDKLT